MSDEMRRLGMVEVRPGVWRSQSDIDEEDEDWRQWRNSLGLVPIEIQGQTFVVEHGGDALVMVADTILAGPQGWYLDGFCPEIEDRRTWATKRIGGVVTEDGIRFEGFFDWLVNRATIAPAVADEYGLVLPPPSARR